MNIKTLLLSLLIASSTYFVWFREGPYLTNSAQPWLAKDISKKDHFAQNIATTVKSLPEIGAYISNISVKHGLRTIQGELAGPGEVKISFNLTWQQSLSDSLTARESLDRAAALAISAVFSQHQDISKIRILLKTPKKNKQVPKKNLGKALGYKNAAKVFSITRAAWTLAVQQNENKYDPTTSQGAANILALGDYVVLTDAGWIRGH